MTKDEKYELVEKQVASLLSGETDIVANMANVSAVLHEAFGFWWTGFYRVDGDHLILGPFQGPVACTRIGYGKGVCGTAWKRRCTVVVPDVDQFPGHIACSSESRSEIVVPLSTKDAEGNDRIVAVLDIDSKELSNFDSTDAFWLEKIAALIH